MIKPRSIFWRYFGIFAAAAFLPIAAMALQGYHCARQAILDDRLLLMRQLSTIKRDEVEAGLRERTRALGILADLPVFRDSVAAALAGSRKPAAAGLTAATEELPEGPPDGLRAFLAGLGRKWVTYEWAAVFDLSGKPIASVGTAGPADLLDEEVAGEVKASAASGLPVPGRIRARRPGVPFLRAAVAVLDLKGEPMAVLIVSIDLSDTIASIRGKDEGEGEEEIRTYILGTDGMPLSSVPGGETGVRAVLAEPPTRFNHEGCGSCSEGRCHYGEYLAPDGVRVIGACYPSKDRKWMVVSESRVSDRALASSLHPFVLGSWTASAVGLGAMLLAGGFLGRRISSPIRSVAEAARRIAQGDLSSRAVYAKADEVGALVSSFNSLVDGLISSREELRSRNRELEDALSQLSRVRDSLVQTESISAVGRAAASVVHEIRNPLSSVKMNLQILSKPLLGDPRFAEHARIARDQLDRLERMLTGLLDFGRPLHLEIQRIEVGRCVERALADIRARAEAKGIVLVTEGSGAIRIKADPDRITQALVNLLANAIDASPEGGRVQIGCSGSDLDGTRLVHIQVRDRGAGIRPEHQEEIFDPFFTTKEGGTGLGLATVKKIVTLHGGKVEVESGPGIGTVMKLVLPAE